MIFTIILFVLLLAVTSVLVWVLMKNYKNNKATERYEDAPTIPKGIVLPSTAKINLLKQLYANYDDLINGGMDTYMGPMVIDYVVGTDKGKGSNFVNEVLSGFADEFLKAIVSSNKWIVLNDEPEFTGRFFIIYAAKGSISRSTHERLMLMMNLYSTKTISYYVPKNMVLTVNYHPASSSKPQILTGMSKEFRIQGDGIGVMSIDVNEVPATPPSAASAKAA